MLLLPPIALGIAVACALPAAAQTKVTLVEAHGNLQPGEEVVLYAVPKQLGYFREEGLEVENQMAQSMQAGQILESGRAQFGEMLPEVALQLREQGGKSIGIFNLKRNVGWSVAVTPDSPIKTLADLQGKTVGVVALGVGSILMQETLVQEKLPPKAYTEVAVGFGPAAATALQAKRVDALLLWDFAYAVMENNGAKLRYIKMPVQEKLLGHFISVTEDYLRSNPATVEKFCRAVMKGLFYAWNNPEAAVRLFQKEFPAVVQPDEQSFRNAVHAFKGWLDNAVDGLKMTDKLGTIPAERVAYVAELNAKYGLIKSAKNPEAAYTERLLDGCNKWDRAPIAAAAKAAK